MGLKNEKGHYLFIAVIESINFILKKVDIRVYEYLEGEDQRRADEEYSNIDRNYCILSVDLPDNIKDIFQKSAYEMLEEHAVKVGENITPAEYDEDGALVAEEIREDVFDFPYRDMLDC